MKKLLYAITFLLPALVFGQVANDLIWTQRKPDNSGNIQRNVSPAANAALGVDANKLPVALTAFTQDSATGAVAVTASGTNQNITLTPSGTGTIVFSNLTSNGLITTSGGTGAVGIAVAGTDYVAPSAYASANGLTMSTARLLGRTTASTGAAEEISVGASLSFSAGTLQLPDTIAAGSVGSSTAIPVLTYDAKGRLTAASTAAVVAPAGTLTGTTLAANVVTSSLTTVGALNSGSIASGFGSIDIGTDTLAAGNTTITGTLGASGKLTALSGSITGDAFEYASGEHRINVSGTSGNTVATHQVWNGSSYSTVVTTTKTGISITGATRLATSGGAVAIGAGGTGDTEAILDILGSSAANRGAYISLRKNGTEYNAIGHESVFIGSGSTANNLMLYGTSGTSIKHYIWGTGTIAEVSSTGLSVTGNITGTGVYSTTTASAANVFVDSNGLLQRSTSSLRYKRDVRDYPRGLADVMKLRPVLYKSIAKGDGQRDFAGLIAEEVDAAGLTEFVVYNDVLHPTETEDVQVNEVVDGEIVGTKTVTRPKVVQAKAPDALAYANMVALTIKAIQELKAENDALRARVAALEARQ